MALGGLFEGNYVRTENTSLLSERWGQDGSTLINLNGTHADDNSTIHTCTTNKKTYVKQIVLIFGAASAVTNSFSLKDGGAGGTARITNEVGFVAAGSQIIFNFTIPLEFSTDIYFARAVASSVKWTILGWEE